jgi:hypothetical protein
MDETARAGGDVHVRGHAAAAARLEHAAQLAIARRSEQWGHVLSELTHRRGYLGPARIRLETGERPCAQRCGLGPPPRAAAHNLSKCMTDREACVRCRLDRGCFCEERRGEADAATGARFGSLFPCLFRRFRFPACLPDADLARDICWLVRRCFCYPLVSCRCIAAVRQPSSRLSRAVCARHERRTAIFIVPRYS